MGSMNRRKRARAKVWEAERAQLPTRAAAVVNVAAAGRSWSWQVKSTRGALIGAGCLPERADAVARALEVLSDYLGGPDAA